MCEEVLLGKGAGQILLEQVSRTGQLSWGSWLSHSPVVHCLTTEFLPGPLCKLGLTKTSPITHHGKLLCLYRRAGHHQADLQLIP